jgi:hypothetical protein
MTRCIMLITVDRVLASKPSEYNPHRQPVAKGDSLAIA